MSAPDLRIYLTPKIWIERDGQTVDERLLPGRQGRVAFAFLVLERQRPVARPELADALWPEELPDSWESSLSAIASKIRTFLSKVGLPGAESLVSAVGCYQLRLPPSTWVDLEAAREGQHDAETLVRRGKWREAWGVSDVGYKVGRRPFLPGATGEWVEQVRRRMRDTFVRAAVLRAELFLWNEEPETTVHLAEEVLAVDPFRESAYRLLIKAHQATGSRAEAVRTYERCRDVLSRELGVDPSPETEAALADARGGVAASRAPSDERVFATVLFTDIVASTPRTAELGDRLWRELLESHDDIVGREIKQCGGRVIKSMGDGLLATFDAPARAVRCASSIHDAVRELGIEIRAGIHAGEVETRGQDLVGIAVNIARRVCDTGGPGDVLVSRTVVDLVAGSGLEFDGRGSQELKGVPGNWDLFALRAEDRV